MVEQADRDGRRIGNYRLVQLLGEGGFAEVYLAEHIHLNTRAAVKLLHTQLANEGIEGFRNEARMIAGLVHPHIVRVLDFGVEHGVPYLVMDYAPNGTLRRRHRRGSRLPLQLVVGYVQQVARALQYAHEQRLIHRDIKPENMLVGRNNEVLLSDFGIALIAQSSHLQKTQDVAGTLTYMAPEQIEAHPRPASDQYSLGIVVYEWLAGQPPFQGTMAEVAIKHATAMPPSLRLFRPELPPAVEQVVLTTLQKEPHARFPSVLAFAQALEQANNQRAQSFASGFAPAPSNESFTNRLPNPQFSQRQSPAPYGSASLSSESSTQLMPQTSDQHLFSSAYTPTPQTLFSPAQTGGSLPPQSAYAPYSPGQLSSLPQTGQPLSQPQGRNLPRRTVIAALAGGAATLAVGGLAYYIYTSAKKGASGLSGIPGLSSATAPLMTFAGHTDLVLGTPWSPNGQYIASASADGTARVWSVSTKQPVFSYSSDIQSVIPQDGAYSVSWQPDSSGIVIGFEDGTAQLVDLATHQQTRLYDSQNADGVRGVLLASSISPDGRYVALAPTGVSNNDILIFDATTQNIVDTLSGHTDKVQSLVWSHDGRYIATGSFDMTVRVWEWDGSNGMSLYTFNKHTTPVYSVSWSPDASHIVSASLDGQIYVWARDNGQTRFNYLGGLAVAWSHNGKYITFSGGNDLKTHVVNAQNYQLLEAFPTGPISSVSWSPNDSRIATASTVIRSDNTLKKNIILVWQI